MVAVPNNRGLDGGVPQKKQLTPEELKKEAQRFDNWTNDEQNQNNAYNSNFDDIPVFKIEGITQETYDSDIYNFSQSYIDLYDEGEQDGVWSRDEFIKMATGGLSLSEQLAADAQSYVSELYTDDMFDNGDGIIDNAERAAAQAYREEKAKEYEEENKELYEQSYNQLYDTLNIDGIEGISAAEFATMLKVIDDSDAEGADGQIDFATYQGLTSLSPDDASYEMLQELRQSELGSTFKDFVPTSNTVYKSDERLKEDENGNKYVTVEAWGTVKNGNDCLSRIIMNNYDLDAMGMTYEEVEKAVMDANPDIYGTEAGGGRTRILDGTRHHSVIHAGDKIILPQIQASIPEGTDPVAPLSLDPTGDPQGADPTGDPQGADPTGDPQLPGNEEPHEPGTYITTNGDGSTTTKIYDNNGLLTSETTEKDGILISSTKNTISSGRITHSSVLTYESDGETLATSTQTDYYKDGGSQEKYIQYERSEEGTTCKTRITTTDADGNVTIKYQVTPPSGKASDVYETDENWQPLTGSNTLGGDQGTVPGEYPEGMTSASAIRYYDDITSGSPNIDKDLIETIYAAQDMSDYEKLIIYEAIENRFPGRLNVISIELNSKSDFSFGNIRCPQNFVIATYNAAFDKACEDKDVDMIIKLAEKLDTNDGSFANTFIYDKIDEESRLNLMLKAYSNVSESGSASDLQKLNNSGVPYLQVETLLQKIQDCWDDETQTEKLTELAQALDCGISTDLTPERMQELQQAVIKLSDKYINENNVGTNKTVVADPAQILKDIMDSDEYTLAEKRYMLSLIGLTGSESASDLISGNLPTVQIDQVIEAFREKDFYYMAAPDAGYDYYARGPQPTKAVRKERSEGFYIDQAQINNLFEIIFGCEL